MRRYEFRNFLLFLALLSLSTTLNAEYWFQTGVRGNSEAAQNNGASVQIQTIVPQTIVSGSMAFWVGENLPNGAFLQVGYVIENQSGYYPADCTIRGCSGRELLTTKNATWFYEYFPVGHNNTFYGSIGPDGAAGVNGTFNTYGFYSVGDTWYFLFDNKTIGSADLGASSSGSEWPVAIGEVANASNNSTYMAGVIFANFSVYKYSSFLPLAEGYGTIGYGAGSRTDLKNPYGLEEVGSRTNYFEVGSGLPQSSNNTKLWTLGYKLDIASPYGGSSDNSYVAYSTVSISTPQIVYINSSARALFLGWHGKGSGSYTGSENSTMVLMDGDITETAAWQVQYLLNVTSNYSSTSGSGWYNSSSVATYGIAANSIYQNGTQRFVFSGWSNGNKNATGSITLTGPRQISANWKFMERLVATNQQQVPIIPDYFIVDGAMSNSTPYLNATMNHSVTGVYYKGLLFPYNLSVDVNSPATVYLPLPVYNVSIKVADYFGLPISTPLSITYKNGTTANLTPTNGEVKIPDVPYGYAEVQARYLWMNKTVVTDQGVPVKISFFSTVNIAAVVVIILVIIYANIKIHTGKGKAKKQAKGRRMEWEY